MFELQIYLNLPDRYRNLPEVSHQEQFLEVQLFLLESFISRLTLEAEETSFAPAGLHYCSVLNSANYINLILQEWSEQMVRSTVTTVQASFNELGQIY